VYYGGKYKFLYNVYSHELDSAAKYGGMGFAQEMMIHDGKRVKCTRPDSNTNVFRALCELDNRVCVIDSKTDVKFGAFIQELLNIGVTEALYVDMGPGWNYSFYKNVEGASCEIYKHKGSYTTNWITFIGE